MEAKKYVLKDIGILIPLYDEKNKKYMIFIDGEPIDIDKNIFDKLFIEYELIKDQENKIEQKNNNVGLLSELNILYNTIIEQIKTLKNMGISNNDIEIIIKEGFAQSGHSEMIDQAMKVFIDILNNIEE